MLTDEAYMARALQLARNGAGHVSPNPMVGAVIAAPDGRIIGEGWHRLYGEAHAEVNAFRSVRPEDEHLIPESTIYVTLEPCSHYGKTPPCAELLARKHIRRAVIGIVDPNPKVAGRGIRMLEEAGIETSTGVLEEECRKINRRFLRSQTTGRPWIQLKWAETAEGKLCGPEGEAIAISTPVTLTLMHRERAMADAIMVGTGTLLNDNPSLTTRHWPGRNPIPVMVESPRIHAVPSGNEDGERMIPDVLKREHIQLPHEQALKEKMATLRERYGVTSLMVEGGPTLLKSFLKEGLWDEIRVEKGSPDAITARIRDIKSGIKKT